MEVIAKLQELRENWLAAKDDQARFPENIKRRKESLENWESEMRSRSLSAGASPRLETSVRQVKSCIEQAENKHATSSWSRICKTLFPSSIGEEMKKIDGLLNGLPQMLREDDERPRLLNNEVLRLGRMEPPIPSDSRYVHFTTSENAIHNVLRLPDGARLILLHGAGGMGKSTLVRHLVMQYSQLLQENGEYSFKSVVLVKCDDSTKIADTMADIIVGLGHDPVPAAAGSCVLAGRLQEVKEYQGNRKLLRGLLAKAKALLVLDDVSDEEYLKKIFELCGPHVKCLVTSRNKDLLRRNDESICTVINMELPVEEEAMKILASHARLPRQLIPERLRMIAQKMVEKAEKIPLVLASLGSMIDHTRRNDLGEWENTYANFSDALKIGPTAAVHNGIYKESFWAATSLAVGELNEDSRKLLVLASVCAGPNIPEEVLRVLFESGKFLVGPGNFSAARKELERSQLVRIDPVVSRFQGNRSRWTWSIHSLHRLYIQEELKRDLESMFDWLNNKHTKSSSSSNTSGISSPAGPRHFVHSEDLEDSTVRAVCYLYFSWEFGCNAIFRSCKVSKVELLRRRGLDLLRRRAIRIALEPIIFLLGRTVLHDWTAIENTYAKQVLVDFTLRRVVLPKCLARLLKHPEAAPAAWMALKGMVNLYSSLHFMEKDDAGLWGVFLERLEANVDSDMQRQALEVICNARMLDFCEYLFTCTTPESTRGDNAMVVALVSLLRRAPSNSDITREIKALCFRALTNVASWAWKTRHPGSMPETLARHPGLIDEIVRALTSTSSLSLREDAAKCLNHVMGRSSIDRRVGIFFQQYILEEYPNLLAILGEVLCKDDDNTSTYNVIRTELLEVLITLTTGPNPQVIHAVADNAALLEALAKVLHQGFYVNTDSSILSNVLEVLYLLCRSRDVPINEGIRDIPGIMNDLLSMITEADSKGLQSRIVRAAGVVILLDPHEAGNINLQSSTGHRARGEAYHKLNMDRESEEDIRRAHELDSKYAIDIYRDYKENRNCKKWSMERVVMMNWEARYWMSFHTKREEFAKDECATKWKNRWIRLIQIGLLHIPDDVEVSEAKSSASRPKKILRRS